MHPIQQNAAVGASAGTTRDADVPTTAAELATLAEKRADGRPRATAELQMILKRITAATGKIITDRWMPDGRRKAHEGSERPAETARAAGDALALVTAEAKPYELKSPWQLVLNAASIDILDYDAGDTRLVTIEIETERSDGRYEPTKVPAGTIGRLEPSKVLPALLTALNDADRNGDWEAAEAIAEEMTDLALARPGATSIELKLGRLPEVFPEAAEALGTAWRGERPADTTTD